MNRCNCRRKCDRRPFAAEGNALKSPKKSTTIPIETFSHIAQIALAIVAIFGYFYTVLPVYQKERLAEQVAEYEGIIKKQAPKIAEAEARLSELAQERQRLSQDLKNVEHDLELARGQKNRLESHLSSAIIQKEKIENQIQYMTFRYRLPDGTPATNPQQVRVAQASELRRSFLSSISVSCALGRGNDDAFYPYAYIKDDDKNKLWPFTDKEIAYWKEFGSKYPYRRALDCVERVATDFSKRYGNGDLADNVKALRMEAIQYVDAANAKSWTPSLEPAELLQELAVKRSEIESEMNAELKKVEEQYGDWEDVFGDSRRAIFKHNYEVGKINAKNTATNKRWVLRASVDEKANLFKKGVNDEVRRLTMMGEK